MKIPLISSLTGRVFAILFLGIAVTALLGLYLVETQRVRDIRELQRVRTIDHLTQALPALAELPPEMRAETAHDKFRMIFDPMVVPGPDESDDAKLNALLEQSLGETIKARAVSVPVPVCEFADKLWHRSTNTPERERGDLLTRTDCWRIYARPDNGSGFSVFVVTPPLFLRETTITSPIFLVTLLLAASLLAFVVARLALTPVRRLTRAARDINPADHAEQIPEKGPTDVREAIEAFNAMRKRLADYHSEQSTMLAAIAHDLQTPLTRLRLKLDKVTDDAARQSLLQDWQAMRAIVTEGLALARAGHDSEKEAILDVDSLLASIAEDEQERGHDVTFTDGAGVDCRCRPQMLRRALQNLIDNAVLYGNTARISTHRLGHTLEIRIEDDGPGIPEDQLSRVFEPMVRLDHPVAVNGIGLGLTSARALVLRCGGSIRLENAADAGLRAVIRLPC